MVILGYSYMCVDTFFVILHEPYEATCMSLPSWVLGPDLSLSIQGLTIGAFFTPLPMDLINDAIASTEYK